MEAIIGDYTGTIIGIHSPIPYQAPESSASCENRSLIPETPSTPLFAAAAGPVSAAEHSLRSRLLDPLVEVPQH